MREEFSDHDDRFHLSPCAETVVWFRGNRFLTAEGAYQWAKNPTDENRHLFKNATGAEARALGRRIKPQRGFDPITTMQAVLKDKYSRELWQKVLFLTAGMELVYLSEDKFWGVNKQGEGENVMGKLLMQLRDQLLNPSAGGKEEFVQKELDPEDPMWIYNDDSVYIPGYGKMKL